MYDLKNQLFSKTKSSNFRFATVLNQKALLSLSPKKLQNLQSSI